MIIEARSERVGAQSISDDSAKAFHKKTTCRYPEAVTWWGKRLSVLKKRPPTMESLRQRVKRLSRKRGKVSRN